MGQDTYFELSKRSILINKNEETTITWDNSFLTARTDKAIHFINFSCNLECLDKIIDCLETSTTTPKNSPASELFRARFLRNEMKNTDMTEMVLNSALWPHNQQLTQEMTVVSKFVWSPRGFLQNEGILAVLNNIGGVELYVWQDSKWNTLLKFSKYVKQFLAYNNSPKTFNDLKKSVYVLCTWAICWSPNINSDRSCYLVTAQMSGAILFWSLQADTTKTCLKGKITSSNNCEISSMIWIPKTADTFWLICADILGQIIVYYCQIENDEIKLLNSHSLWEYKDRMIPKNMKYEIVNDRIIFICSKHRHLLVQLLDEDCKVVSQYVNNINDYQITCITKSNDGFYLSTVNCKVYKIDVTISNNVLDVNVYPIEIKDTFSTHDLYSISFSHNNVLLVLGMVDRKVLCRKEFNNLEIILMSTESKLDALLPTLLSTKTLTNHWDCIEVLRYRMVKHKTLPQVDLDHLTAAKDDVNKLKISLIVAIVYNNLKKVMRISTEVKLPYESVEMIREKIMLAKATSLIKQLHTKNLKEKTLTGVDDESLFGAKTYIQYCCKKYEMDAHKLINTDLLSIKNSVYEYVCQCCDEKIVEFSCKNGHPNVFCSQTFTPIMSDDYFACKGCGYTVRSDLNVESPLCLFCDLYLINSFTPVD